MPESKKQLLTITQAADLLGVNQKTLRSWADKGFVGYIRTPTGYRRFEPEEIERLLEEMRTGKIAA